MPALILTFLFIGVGWYLIIRPQQERAKAQRALIEALAVGDRVISAGGIHGTLVEVSEQTVRLEVAPDVVLTLARPAIARRIEDGDDAVDDGTTGAAADPVAGDVDDGAVPGQPGAPVEDDVTNSTDGSARGQA